MNLFKLRNICFCLDRLFWEKDTPDYVKDRLEEISKELWGIFNNELRNYKQE